VAVATRVEVAAIEVEIQCSDREEHRRRVEQRLADGSGVGRPSWADVVSRDYRVWEREYIPIETAGRSVKHSVATLHAALTSR